MVRFDAYSATTTEVGFGQLADLFGPGLTVKEGHGFHQFGHRLSFKDDTGSEVGSVQWGGKHADACRSMIEVKGERSPEVVERLRSLCEHRVTRMDSCADFDAPGSFKRLLGVCMRVKRRHRLKGERAGDWQDFPELGRTQYLGATTSATRLRLYEKGKQPEYCHLKRPEWVRAEVQVRPVLHAKSHYSTISALDAWGASAWTQDLASEILKDHIDPHRAGTTWRLSERDKAIAWMCKQYGSHLVGMVEDLGSWECLGLTLRDLIAEQRVSLEKLETK
jgi:hypothetical protein